MLVYSIFFSFHMPPVREQGGCLLDLRQIRENVVVIQAKILIIFELQGNVLLVSGSSDSCGRKE